MQVVDIILSPYELVLREIEKGTLDPFDIDLEYLIELFRKEAEDLKEWEYFEEAGRFLEASTKLIKLQIEEIFPRPESEKKRITIKEVREALAGSEDTYPEYDLSWLWEHEVRVGRPSGAKDGQDRKLTWKEFWDQAENVPLHKGIDYRKLAEQVRKLLKEGRFRIRTLTDFIAYLHAYMEFEDVPELPELSLTVGTQV